MKDDYGVPALLEFSGRTCPRQMVSRTHRSVGWAKRPGHERLEVVASCAEPARGKARSLYGPALLRSARSSWSGRSLESARALPFSGVEHAVLVWELLSASRWTFANAA